MVGANDGEEVLNLSDVLDVISSIATNMAAPGDMRPFVRIVEQPASRALRFRYECEGRSAGSIPGVNSTSERRTYPSIEIVNYTGRAVIVVSCVTATSHETSNNQARYRSHPHNLVGRDKCKDGVCTVKINITPDNRTVTFSNLGIQCVKKRDIAEALRIRETIKVDPFRAGFGHKSQPQNLDLNAVRLCFQVFLPDERRHSFDALPPVVSDIIYDKKAMSDPQIMRVSRAGGSVNGGDEMIILCEKVTREDIAVLFYEERNGERWEASAHVVLVHKQVAVVLHTPRYAGPSAAARPHHDHNILVNIILKRLSDGEVSQPVTFEYIQPAENDYVAGKKRKALSTYLSSFEKERQTQPERQIKAEPKERLSPHNITSPPLVEYQDPNYQWQMQTQGNITVAQNLNPFTQHDMQWGGNYDQPSTSTHPQNLQPMQSVQLPQYSQASPLQIHGALSPIHGGVAYQGSVSPMHKVMSPMQGGGSSMHGGVSPMHGGVSPMHGGVSPMQGGVSPMHGGVSPMHGGVSPVHGCVSPMHGGIPPMQSGVSLMHGGGYTLQGIPPMSPMQGVRPVQDLSPMLSSVGATSPMHCDGSQPPPTPNVMHHQSVMQPSTSDEGPSLSMLLAADAGPGILSSGDLDMSYNLLNTRQEPDQELSDSLRNLSTGDLLQMPRI